MIRDEDVFYIGKVSKWRGICGDVEILFTDDAFDRGEAEYLVLDMDGILVPFFWTEYRFKNDQTAIFHFENIESEHDAKRIMGAKVFYPKNALPADDEDTELRSWKALTGFTVYDAEEKVLGIVEEVDDRNMNILLTIRNANDEAFLVPYHDDFLVEFSMTERSIVLDLPPGILEIND
jgi:16S rRNA processing protein RimM